MKIKSSILTLVLMMSQLSATWAQDTYTIYPVPHKQTVLKGKTSFTEKVTVVAGADIDQITIDRAVQILSEKGLEVNIAKKRNAKTSNVLLGVNPNVLKVNGKYDRHKLVLTGKKTMAEVQIVGENTDATFCGLASLEQILDSGTNNLQCVAIDDYADIQYRGVIEGYYGVPYNADVTKDLFRFMARYKMNSYMYGAKSDPYHSQKWAEAYPDSITAKQKEIGYLSADMMADIINVSHKCKVNFIWAIHPGEAFTKLDDDSVIGRVMSKFNIMYDLGVRQFGLFVDDIGVPIDELSLKINAERLSKLQGEVENKWNKNYVTPADTVKPINFVPQLYAYSWVKPEVRANYFKALGKTHPSVIIYITGANVWSVPNSHDLEVVSSELGRGLAWWWNYPCNDNDMTKLFVRDTYSNFADEKWIDNNATLPKTLKGASALISNPMQQGVASKIALFGVGDYGWNNAAFDNMNDFHAAVKAVVGKTKATDFEYLSQFLRHYDKEPMETIVAQYKNDSNSAPVKAEMTKLLQACNSIEEMASFSESDSLFVADIKPWVNRLSDMAYLTIQLLDQIDKQKIGQQTTFDSLITVKLKKTIAEFDMYGNHQFNVLNGMGDDIELSTRVAEPSGIVLRPFLDYLGNKLQTK